MVSIKDFINLLKSKYNLMYSTKSLINIHLYRFFKKKSKTPELFNEFSELFFKY